MSPKVTSKVFVFNPVGEVLLTQRSLTDRNRPGAFDLPGGGVEQHEEFTEGAIRETFEETGIVISDDRLEFLGFSSARSKFGHGNARYFYYAQIDERAPKLIPDPKEVSWLGWVGLEEAIPKLGHEVQQYMGTLLMRQLTPQRELLTVSQKDLLLASYL